MRLTVMPSAKNGQVKRRWYIFILLCILSVLAACGRKAPPIAPGTAPPPQVTDLTAVLQDDRIVLRWSLSAQSVADYPQLEAFRLYQEAVAKSEEVCQKCPRKFERIAEMPLTLATDLADGSQQWQYKVPADSGYRYAFKVNMLSSDKLGPDSNIVEIEP